MESWVLRLERGEWVEREVVGLMDNTRQRVVLRSKEPRRYFIKQLCIELPYLLTSLNSRSCVH